VTLERCPSLLPDHTVYIHLWKNEVLQLFEVHVTHNGSGLGEKQWSVNLRSAYSISNIHLRIVSHMVDNLMRIL
jgi:hypothetical protein